MHRTEHAVEIARTPDVVFGWITEPDKVQQWIGGLVSSEQLTAGGPRVGARSREVIAEHGQRVELNAEITRYRPNEEFQVRLRGPGFDAMSTFELRERGGATIVRNVIETRFKLMLKMLAPVLAARTQRKLEDDLARLKRLAEAV